MNMFSILPLCFCILLNLNAASQPFIGKCLIVLDDDTVDVSRNGSVIRIRLEGIDYPERDQPFAEQAKAFTAKLIAGKMVTVVEKEKDTYGRTVARVFVEGRDVSVELLKAGLAVHYRRYNSDWLLAALEQHAKADRVGMWASGTALSTSGIIGSAAAADRAPLIVYHGNVKSKVFHGPQCRHYNCKNCTREFKSREEAIAAGYKPCGICKP